MVQLEDRVTGQKNFNYYYNIVYEYIYIYIYIYIYVYIYLYSIYRYVYYTWRYFNCDFTDTIWMWDLLLSIIVKVQQIHEFPEAVVTIFGR